MHRLWCIVNSYYLSFRSSGFEAMPLKIGCFGLPKKWLQESSCSYINVLCKRRLHFEIRPVIQCRLKYPGAAVKSSIHSYQGSAHRKLILISPFYSCATRIHFLEEDVLPRCNPSLTQICRYHIFSGNRNSCYRVKQNCFPETSLHHPQINVVIKRHLSLAWLDSLAITQASWFQALSQSRLVEGLMTGLQGIHDQLHLPWWAAIIVSTILMRGILTLPVTVYQVWSTRTILHHSECTHFLKSYLFYILIYTNFSIENINTGVLEAMKIVLCIFIKYGYSLIGQYL